MRKLLIGLVILAALLTGAWYGAETWLSRTARDLLAGRQDVSATVTPIRQPGRLGLRLTDIEVAEGGAEAAKLSGMMAYVSLMTPATLTVDLPQAVTLSPTSAAPTDLGISDGKAEVTLSPTRQMAISHAGISGRNLAVNGTSLAGLVDATATLTHMGGAAPAGSAAAYRVDLNGGGLDTGTLPEPLDIAGTVQVWLDAVPDRALLEGSARPPQPTGLQTRALIFKLGDKTARLAGRIEADADGLASGQAAIYTSDGPAFIDAAAEAGLLPPDVATPLHALVTRLAGEPAAATEGEEAPETAESAVDRANAEIMAEEIVVLPPAGPGEIKLPIFLQDGVMRLGPIPLGAAPRIAMF